MSFLTSGKPLWRIALVVVSWLPLSATHAQVPAFDRAVACTASLDAGFGPQRLVVDGQGNTLAAGQFNGSVLLGTSLLTAAGSSAGFPNVAPPDVFVTKLDAGGSYVWAAQLSGPLWEDVAGVAVDAAGDVYVTGSFLSFSVSLGPGITLFNSSARSEAYIAKLSGATGQWLWAKRCGGTGNDTPAAVAISATGEVYVAGNSGSRTADFGPVTLNNAQYGDAFIAKLSAAGAWQWARQAGSGRPRISGMVLDAQGGIYLAGTFYPTADFGATTLTTLAPRTATTYSGSPGEDLFVAKITDLGTWLWAVQGDPNGQNQIGVSSIAYDGIGHLYLGGAYGWLSARIGSTTLPNLSTTNTGPQAPIGQVSYWTDAYVARLNTTSGAWEWANRAGGAQADGVGAVAADGQGRVYVAGAKGFYTRASNGFENPLTGGGRVNMGQLNSSTGAWQWTMLQPDTYPEQLTIDGVGRVYMAGLFKGATASFGPVTLAQQGGGVGATGYLARLGAGPLATTSTSSRPDALQLWPNPTAGSLVQVQGPAPGQLVQVLDALGRVVATGRMPVSGPLGLVLPASLSAGVYVVRSGGQARQLVVE